MTRGRHTGDLDSCLRRNDTCWIPACAGMTRGRHTRDLDSRLRGNNTRWIPACAGMTRGRHTRGGLGSRLRRNDTREQTQRSLGSRLRGNDTCWIPACAGMTRRPSPVKGEAGFPLAEGEAGLGVSRPVPWRSFPRRPRTRPCLSSRRRNRVHIRSPAGRGSLADAAP